MLSHGLYNLFATLCHQLTTLCKTSQDCDLREFRCVRSIAPCKSSTDSASATVAGLCTHQATQKRDSGHVGMRRLVAGLVGQLSSLTVGEPPAQVEGLVARHQSCTRTLSPAGGQNAHDDWLKWTDFCF